MLLSAPPLLQAVELAAQREKETEEMNARLTSLEAEAQRGREVAAQLKKTEVRNATQ